MATSRVDSQLSKILRGQVYQQKTASRQIKPMGPSRERVGNTVRSPNEVRASYMTYDREDDLQLLWSCSASHSTECGGPRERIKSRVRREREAFRCAEADVVGDLDRYARLCGTPARSAISTA
jgi:hypothetical protein